MSAVRGYPRIGLGKSPMWGLSPATDLLESLDVSKSETDTLTLNLLLVGETDGRHVLKTLESAERNYPDKDIRLNFYLIENTLELYARQMALHMLALQPLDRIGLGEKTAQFLEVFGNTFIRPQTRRTVEILAGKLSNMISDEDTMLEEIPIFNASQLKYSERDGIADIFKVWKTISDPQKLDMKSHWENRVQQYLGQRYDTRWGAFDWDYNMYMRDNPALQIISSNEYMQWRNTGIAFSAYDSDYSQPNPTLISSSIVNGAWRSSYWGDIVNGPFLAHGVRTENEDLLFKVNDTYKHNARDVSSYNLERILAAVSPKTTEELKMKAEKCSINFLPMDALTKMKDMPKYQNSFHLAYIGAAVGQKLGEDLFSILKAGGVILAEGVNYGIEFRPEHREIFASKLKECASNSGLITQDGEGDFLRFVKESPGEADVPDQYYYEEDSWELMYDQETEESPCSVDENQNCGMGSGPNSEFQVDPSVFHAPQDDNEIGDVEILPVASISEEEVKDYKSHGHFEQTLEELVELPPKYTKHQEGYIQEGHQSSKEEEEEISKGEEIQKGDGNKGEEIAKDSEVVESKKEGSFKSTLLKTKSKLFDGWMDKKKPEGETDVDHLVKTTSSLRVKTVADKKEVVKKEKEVKLKERKEDSTPRWR